ncbi:cytoplasmic polyadenylation element-binding protein 1 [Plutella xylostella]|uniref:cytoplasmic polyadenylation element-binding protein 1 n=1 Tax=Plutella xylostella TaxID=51655 RepID=UPI002032EF40|nr:cytoplasmic polyadenylation element-binding protein 1 [Plutella xylostella]
MIWHRAPFSPEVGVACSEHALWRGDAGTGLGFPATGHVASRSVVCAQPPRLDACPKLCPSRHPQLRRNFAAAMPLIHQDNGRSGGGEHRRSLAELLGLDTSRLGEPAPAAPRMNHRDGGSAEWGWERAPSSPEAAQTPRSLVPARCFPPRHPTDFASFSESARPGAGWGDDTGSSGQGITDLVASLKALAMPAAPRKRQSFSQTSIRVHYSCDGFDRNMEPAWSPDQNHSSDGINGREEHPRLLPRRASFCGVLSSERNGEPLSWTGSLPARCLDLTSGISPKVFMGGLPWDITEQALLNTLRQFQPVCVEWPEREHGGDGRDSPKGYAHVTFESERCARALLAACHRRNNGLYYRVASRKIRSKEAQVIPWSVSDAMWVSCGSARLQPERTVFVGALHGMLTAAALARIMDDLFTGVVYAGIDTDKNKYPIGSGRVTFNNVRSYVRAISAGYVEITTDKFNKKVQLLPYLEDSMCSVCNLQQGPYFCREPVCYRYFCRSCWQWRHPNKEHAYLTRSSKHAPGALYHATYSDQANEGTPSPPMSGGSSDPSGADESPEPALPWPL